MNQFSPIVEVFKTDIRNKRMAHSVVKSLAAQFPGYKINVDFEDCDKILRVESDCKTNKNQIEIDPIIEFMQRQNVKIEPLS